MIGRDPVPADRRLLSLRAGCQLLVVVDVQDDAAGFVLLMLVPIVVAVVVVVMACSRVPTERDGKR